jgi:hypothetical protein
LFLNSSDTISAVIIRKFVQVLKDVYAGYVSHIISNNEQSETKKYQSSKLLESDTPKEGMEALCSFPHSLPYAAFLLKCPLQ